MSFLCLQSSCSQLGHPLSSLWLPKLVFTSNHYLYQYIQTLIPHSFIYCQVSTNGTILRKCISFLASIYIQEHILLLFIICTPAYLSVTVVLKHSLCISYKSWIEQLDLSLLSSFMGQCQFRITSHKQACLHMVVNSTIDKNIILFKSPFIYLHLNSPLYSPTSFNLDNENAKGLPKFLYLSA